LPRAIPWTKGNGPFSSSYASGGTQYLDAFALNHWPSKKHWRVAYEVKISRNDFLRELKTPEKRNWGVSIANEFFFVCAPGVARPEEIPTGCGLLEANKDGTKLKRTVVAPQRDARELTLAETCALVRNSSPDTLLSKALWRVAGDEVTGDALVALLDAKMEDHVRAKIEDEIAARLESEHAAIAGVLDNYAFHLERAGLPAPEWMRDWRPGLKPDISVTSWARDVIYPGPTLRPIQNTRRSLKALKEQVKNALTLLDEAELNLADLMAHPSSTSSRAIKDGPSPAAGLYTNKSTKE
jgi:hypothetical protein